MGQLVLGGNTQEWGELEKRRKYIKEHGIIQFLNVYNKFKDRVDEEFLWGDEIEMLILRQNPDTKKVYLSQRGDNLINSLHTTLSNPIAKGLTKYVSAIYHHEYANYMIEATPGVPYGDYTSDLRLVQLNMSLRRYLILLHLQPDEIIVTSPIFPLLGVKNIPDYTCTEVPEMLYGPISNSQYLSDNIISPHPRFSSLTLNIRKRRGRNIDIRVPQYQDIKTNIIDTKKMIHGDAMGFGMGLCCQQVTFQTRSQYEARFLYDQLAILSPLFQALTSNTPFFRGMIASCDVRWNIISSSVDDRSEDEITDEQELLLKNDVNRIEIGNEVGIGVTLPYGPQQQSRYSCIDCYVGGNQFYNDIYNDIPFRYDKDLYDELRKNDVDTLLSKHISSQFVRDPQVCFEDRIVQDDTKSVEHFESQQSTNWRSVRLKPPTLDANIGWRIEFRTMEIQMTDFESAAFTVFVTLLARAIAYFNLNFYIPLTKVYKNFEQAHLLDPITNGHFYMRNVVTRCIPKEDTDTNLPNNQYCGNSNPFLWELKEQIKVLEVPCCAIRSKPCAQSPTCPQSENKDECLSPMDDIPLAEQYTKMTLEEAFCGKSPHYPGQIPLVRSYLDHIKCDIDTRKVIDKYITLIEYRVKKKLMTGAEWQRRYAMSHPTYKQDSMLTTEIVYDLVSIMADAANGFVDIPEMVGTLAQQAHHTYAHIHNQDQNVPHNFFHTQKLKHIYSDYNLNKSTQDNHTCKSFEHYGMHTGNLEEHIIKGISVIESECQCRSNKTNGKLKYSYDKIAQLTEILSLDSTGPKLLGSHRINEN